MKQFLTKPRSILGSTLWGAFVATLCLATISAVTHLRSLTRESLATFGCVRTHLTRFKI
jgi:hypothetical protein